MIFPEQGFLRECQSILTLYLGTILAGFNMGFSAIAIPDIQSELEIRQNTNYTESQFVLPSIDATGEQLSWFASSVNIGQIIGCFCGGYIAGKYGPKFAIQISCIIGVVGWLLMSVSPHLSLLIIGRIICGFGSSFSSANCSMLVAQFSSKRWRGAFLSLFALMVGTGILISYILGAGLYWRYVAAVPPILYFLLCGALFFIPESPIWLLGHKGERQAKDSLVWLRCTDDVDDEIVEIKATMEKQSHGLTMKEAMKNLSKPNIRTPFLIILFNFFFIMFSGPFAVIFYSVDIYKNSGVQANDHVAAIISAAVRVGGGIIGIFLIQRFPRVKLAALSINIMGLSMTILGVALYFKSIGFEGQLIQTLPLIFVTLYMFAFGAGAGPLQWVLLAELLPPEYKVLSGLIGSCATGVVFIVTKAFPTMLIHLTPHGTYWLFASVALSSNFFYIFLVPESKGKTPLEMQKMFNKTKDDN